MTGPLFIQFRNGDSLGESDFVLRVSKEHADDLVDALNHGGCEAEIPLSHDDDHALVDILLTVASAIDGIDGVARLIAVYLARHEKKLVVLSDGTSMSGYDARGVARILQSLRDPGGETSSS